MVVATGTVHSQPKKTARNRIDDHEEDLIPLFNSILIKVSNILRVSQEAGGSQGIDDFGRELGSCTPIHQLVTGQLLRDEPVIRLIFIEGVDHIVAISPDPLVKVNVL